MKPGGVCQEIYWGQRRFNLTNEDKHSRLVLNAYQALKAAKVNADHENLSY
jgi:hypothetical protein